jgi:hypothetical protein
MMLERATSRVDRIPLLRLVSNMPDMATRRRLAMDAVDKR